MITCRLYEQGKQSSQNLVVADVSEVRPTRRRGLAGLIAGIYGMNFVHMPELTWRFGYLYALLLMGGSGGMLWLYFRRRGWL